MKVGIYNPATGKSIYLDAGDPTDRYFTNISWAPDEKSLYLIEVNRDQNHAKLCQYNVETGKLTKVLYEETHPKYVEPQNPIIFSSQSGRTRHNFGFSQATGGLSDKFAEIIPAG